MALHWFLDIGPKLRRASGMDPVWGRSVRYPRAVVLHALPAVRPARRLTASLAALLVALLLIGPVAPSAFSQTLIAPPQTKEEAAEQREAAAEAAAEQSGGSGIGIEVWLALAGVVLIAGATVYMLRDSRAATGGDPRQAPVREAVNPRTTRGAPKNMFEGESKPGGQVGKQAKRTKSKRQKQARKANRPR